MSQVQKIIEYGADWCADCHRVRDIFGTQNIAYEYRNSDDPKVHAEMLKLVNGKNEIPVLLFPDGSILQNPDNTTLLKKLGVKVDGQRKHDVVMIGAGPAALTAAIYTTREDIETVLVERGVVGGLAAVTDKIDNYPGFADGIEGLTLADNLRKQAERFGAVIDLGEVTAIVDQGQFKQLQTSDGHIYARAVLIATGSDYKKIGVPGEKEYYARGVHYCATCDGAFYRDKHLVVIGGGNSAVQETIFLTRFASHIDLLVRSSIKASDVLQADLAKMVKAGKVSVHLETSTNEIVGQDNGVTKVVATDNKSARKIEFPTDGVFVFVGLQPNSQFLAGSKVQLDEIGLVKTNQRLETAIPGVFAAGDIRSGATMQIASAAGEGATAALMIREYLEAKPHPIQN
ncbi:MAG TPA: FAD-dependent oxidoreductase [Candidatus Dormibacteraeota bacterium]|nr:FAD-dependent oxidoreductase [Candidatus Dormibacteraeota bacterium]